MHKKSSRHSSRFLVVINENQKDRENQREVMEAILLNLSATAFVGHCFHYRLCPTVAGKKGHDFNVFLWETHIGAVEVKCRKYDTAFFNRNGYMISHHKLAHLWRINREGVQSMLAFRTSDQHVYASMIDYLIEHKNEWSLADPEMMKTTDHGKRERVLEDKGFTIPLHLFTRMS
jgi:hypothetical protein